MKQGFYYYGEPFVLENGAVLPELVIAYHTAGKLNDAADNVIWICHDISTDSNVEDWWGSLAGKTCVFDTLEYFVVCANVLGSCFGTTGPLATDPESGAPYYHSFPAITIRDMVRVHDILRRHLGIRKIEFLAGAGMGGYQVLEWAIMKPFVFRKLLLIATAAKQSSWRMGLHTAQRMAIEADPTWAQSSEKAGEQGFAAARALNLVANRSHENFELYHAENNNRKLDGYKASNYVRYMAAKQAIRFNAFSFYTLSKAMDTHNIARLRYRTSENVLQGIRQPALVIGFSSDLVCPFREQEFLAAHIRHSKLVRIHSPNGHEGWLSEEGAISQHLQKWMEHEQLKIIQG